MDLSNFIQKIIFSASSGVIFGILATEKLISWLTSHGIKIALILIGAYLVNRFLKSFIEEITRKSLRDHFGEARKKRVETLISIFTGTASFLIAIFVVSMILAELGVNIGPILAGLGVAGLAVGMAARDIIADFISGLFIIIEDQYNKGDRVMVAGLEGEVEEITLRRTTIRDESGVLHSIPNNQIKIVSRVSQQKNS